ELTIHHAVDGLKALAFLQDCVPDVIILDLGMPGMNGWQLLEKIREQEALQAIPVIVLTAHSDYENRKTGKLFQVSAYLQKPIDLVALRNALDNAIYLRQAPKA